MKNYTKAVEYVSFLDSICDIVIVSFHGGAEGYTLQVKNPSGEKG